jgi:signal transduction histidine kinase
MDTSPPAVDVKPSSEAGRRTLTVVCRAAATFLIVAGSCVLLGWQFRVPLLRGEFQGTFVAPLTALYISLLGGCIFALGMWPDRRGVKWVTRFVALVVILHSLEIVWETVTGQYLPFHARFFAHRMDDWLVTPTKGRYSFPAAMAFFFAASSLLFQTLRRYREASVLYIPSLAVAYLALIGYAYSVQTLYGGYMALNTAMLFLILGIALACLRPDYGMPALLISDQAGGIVFRRMFPLVVIAFPMLGGLRLELQKDGWVSSEIGTALFVITTVIIFVSMLISMVRALDRLDTERTKAIAVMQQSEKLAVAGRLASTVAHEINNPLEAIVNLVYLLRLDPSLSAEAREYVKIMEQELARVSHMTRRTLGFYRETSSAIAVSLNDVVREITDIYGALAERRGINLRLALGADFRVRTVPTELRQILLNILINALEASPSTTGIVTVGTRAEDGFGVIEVEDNGDGIPADLQQKIFTPFFTTKQDTGTGIGLWVSRQLAEKSAGDLQFESQPGRTVFRLRLPLEPAVAIASD